MKRIVMLEDKATGQKTPFPFITTLIRKVGDEVLGINLNSLYNALSTGKGKWENKKYKVWYKDIPEVTNVWK